MISIISALLLISPFQVATYVQALNPNISEARATRLGAEIYDAATKQDIDPNILAAIVRQESNFRNVKVCYIAKRNHACYSTCDYGLGQVNQVWIEKWALDADRLLHDEAYNLRISARILKGLHDEFGDEPLWFSTYNSKTPSSRVKYEAKLTPWLDVLQES